jgi:hypothetical protein
VKTQTNDPAQSNGQNQSQGFFAQPRAYLSKDGEYLTLVLPGNMIVRKHVNYFKAVMGLPFSPKSKQTA